MKVLTKQNRKGNKSLHQKVKFWDLDLFSHFFHIVGAAADLNYSARLFFFSLLCFIFFLRELINHWITTKEGMVG